MNSVHLIGRMVSDPEISMTQSGKKYTRFRIAINRHKRNDDGQNQADFIPCVAWEKTAELLCRYVLKGHRIGISGRLQSGTYEKNGQKTFTLGVLVNELEFLERKQESQPGQTYNDNPANTYQAKPEPYKGWPQNQNRNTGYENPVNSGYDDSSIGYSEDDLPF